MNYIYLIAETQNCWGEDRDRSIDRHFLHLLGISVIRY